MNNLSTATSVTGGILLGIILLVIGIIIWFVFLMLKKRKKSISPKHGGKSSYVVGGIGLVITVVSLIAMLVTGTTSGVGTILSTMKSDSKAICDGKMYVKTDFTYNGNNDYKLSKAEGVISGASDLNTLKGYSEYKILVSLNTNISGVIFVEEDSERSFEEKYTDYDNFKCGAVFDTKDKKMSTNESDISTSLFEKVISMDNYKEVDKDKISYVDKIDTKQNCTFWGTSDDELVTSQVKLFPKDKNKKYIRVVDSKYYELDDSLTKTVDRYFK